jgi:hypothetical protein
MMRTHGMQIIVLDDVHENHFNAGAAGAHKYTDALLNCPMTTTGTS